MKQINCVVCNKEMTVDNKASLAVCSQCIQSGRYFVWKQSHPDYNIKKTKKRKTKKEKK